MSKPRDFWIGFSITGNVERLFYMEPDSESLEQYKIFEPLIHVREVVPIDWDKVWEKYWEKFEGQNHKIGDDYIQQLVEMQLKG